VLLEGAPSGSTIYRTKSTSCSAESRIASSMSLGVGDAVDGATKAANASGLPQGIGGPADAYRHLLIAGELKRRFGPTIGASLANAYEFLNRREGQSELNRRMDDVNNDAALNGPDVRTFEELQRWARGKITEAAPFNGDGHDGRLMWHLKTKPGWMPDWSKVLLSIERGAEHHWRSKPGSGVPGRRGDADPFARVLAAWSEEDIAAVMQSRPYLRSGHPDHVQAQALVRAWFDRKYGADRAARDATAPHAEGAGTRVGRARGPRPRAHARGRHRARARAYALLAGLSRTGRFAVRLPRASVPTIDPARRPSAGLPLDRSTRWRAARLAPDAEPPALAASARSRPRAAPRVASPPRCR
jgi:hypothetical protein